MTTFGDMVFQMGGAPVTGALPFTTGSYYFVHSGTGSSASSGNNPSETLATVAQGIAKCTASKGDVVVVMPGHAETITNATGIDLDVIGITVYCVGNGTLAPTITFATNTTATITISAASCTWDGGIMFANLLDVASAFTLGAAKGTTIKNVRFEDSSSILNFLSAFTTGATDNDCDGLKILDNEAFGLNTTPLAFISILAAEERVLIRGNVVDMASTADVGSFLTLAAKNVLGLMVLYNTHNVIGATGNLVGIFITGSGTSTGMVMGNQVASLDTTTQLISTAGTGLRFNENYLGDTADKSAIVWPVVT